VAELVAAFDSILPGQGCLFLVTGDPGIGKTRLVQELAQRVQPRCQILWGRCLGEGGVPPYWPWQPMLRALLDSLPSDMPTRILHATQRVQQTFPAVDTTGYSRADWEVSQQARFLLFDDIATIVEYASQRCPLLLVLDDLHEADTAALQLLLFLARVLPRLRALIVGTYRESEARRIELAPILFGELAREGHRIPLHGLRNDDVRELIRHAAGTDPSGIVVDAVQGTAEGNPFFVDALVHQWRADGGQVDCLDPTLLRLRLPERARQVVAQRLSRLRDETRRVLEAAACLGLEFDAYLLAAIVEPASHAATALEEARIQEVVAPPTGFSTTWRFAHALLRESICDDLGRPERAQLHLRIAEHLQAKLVPFPSSQLPALAYHLREALPLVRASSVVDAAEGAARHLFSTLAFEQAAVWYTQAISIAEAAAALPERVPTLLLGLTHAWHRAAVPERAREAVQRAQQLATELADPVLFGRAVLLQARMQAETGRVHDTLIERLREALLRLPDEDGELRVGLMGQLATSLYFSTARPERTAISQAAVAMARRLNQPAALIAALRAHHFAIWQPGTAGDRLRVIGELLALAEGQQDRTIALEARDWRCVDLLELGDIAAMREEVERYSVLAQELRHARSVWHISLIRATLALFSRPLAECEPLLDAALQEGQRIQAENALQFYAVQVFSLRLEQQRLHELEPTVRMLIERFPALPVWRCAAAFLYGELGLQADARRELDALAVDDFRDIPRDSNWLISMTLLAEVVVAFCHRPYAKILFDQLLPFRSANTPVGPAASSFGSVARPLSLLACVLQEWPAAIHLAGEAEAANRRMGSPLWTAYSMLARLAAEHGSGAVTSLEGSTAALIEIEGIAESLGAPRLRSRVAAWRHQLASAAVVPAAAAAAAAAAGAAPARPQLRRCGRAAWEIIFAGRTVHVRDLKGIRYLAELLACPGRALHVAELVDLVAQADTHALRQLGPFDSILRRLRELRREHAEAQAENDVGRMSCLATEIHAAMQELVARAGTTPDDLARLESLRISVTRAIGLALSAIAKQDSELRRYLGASVSTGRMCVYDPRRVPID